MTNTAPHNRPLRPWLLACGWLLFGLGALGIALPLLPTTVFWIGAIWCWSRSSPRLSQRLLSHPRFGRPVHLFIERGEMTRQGKGAALCGMAVGFLLLQLGIQPAWSVSLSVGLVLALTGLWLWRRPEPQSAIPAAKAGPTLSDPARTATDIPAD